MRTVEEIKADMKEIKSCLPKNYTNTDMLGVEYELREALIYDIPTDRLEEICEAERDGRLVILPCKVGDAVYVISNEPCPYNCKHQYRNDGQFNIWHKENNNNCKQCEYIDKKYIWEREFYLDDLARVDKTVFLTQAEAEKALKGGAE